MPTDSPQAIERRMPPWIMPPNDGYQETTSRIQLAMGAGLLFKETIGSTLSTSGGLTPTSSGSLLDPFNGDKERMAQLATKISPFMEITVRLNQAGNELVTLEREIDVLEEMFNRIDLSPEANAKLRSALTGGSNAKDSDKIYLFHQLEEKSIKTREQIASLRQKLSSLKPKLKAKETVLPGELPKSIVVMKNNEMAEAYRSPANKVHDSVPKKLKAMVHSELEQPIATIQKEIRALQDRVNRQKIETTSLAPENVKLDININIARPGES